MKLLLLLPLFLICLLPSGCASEKEEINVGEIYMRQSLSTGMLAVALDNTLREEAGLPGVDGMYIVNVEPKSKAAAAHLKAGDVLLQVGDIQVYDKESFARAFYEVEDDSSVKVKVWRGGGVLTLKLPLGL